VLSESGVLIPSRFFCVCNSSFCELFWNQTQH